MSYDKSSKNENIEDNARRIIQISESTSIVIKKSVWKDMERLDIRTYIKTENYTGPTKKGINVPIEKLDEIIYALKELKESKSDGDRMLTESEKAFFKDQ